MVAPDRSRLFGRGFPLQRDNGEVAVAVKGQPVAIGSHNQPDDAPRHHGGTRLRHGPVLK